MFRRKNLFPILLLACCVSFLPESLCQNQPVYFNKTSLYTFQNRRDNGFLTAVNLRSANAPVISDLWKRESTQKWSTVKAYFSTSYQLRPESNTKRLLELNLDTGLAVQDNVGWGLWNIVYWQALNLGQGYHLIKNHKTGDCLTSSGLGEPVSAVQCDSDLKQQWAIRELKRDRLR